MKIFFEANTVNFASLIEEDGVGFKEDIAEGTRLEAQLDYKGGFARWTTENGNVYTAVASNKGRSKYSYEGEESDFLEDQCLPNLGKVEIDMVIGDYGVFTSGDADNKTKGALQRYDDERRNYIEKATKLCDATSFEESINPQNVKNRSQIVEELALVLHGAGGRRIC